MRLPRRLILWLLLIVFSAPSVWATSYVRHDPAEYAKLFPIIIKATPEGIVSQEYVQLELHVVYRLKVNAVYKNIISDVTLKPGQIIEVSYDVDSLDVRPYQTFLQGDAFGEGPRIVLLNLTPDGFHHWRHPDATHAADQEANLRANGAFEPVYLDGDAVSCTKAEWLAQERPYQWVTLSGPDAFFHEPSTYPEHWPQTEEAALSLMRKQAYLKQMANIYGAYRYSMFHAFFREIGLQDDAKHVNLRLLRDMQATTASEAQSALLEALYASLPQDEEHQAIIAAIKEFRFDKISLPNETQQTFADLLAALSTRLNGEADLGFEVKLQAKPNLSHSALPRLSLRNLDAIHVLNFAFAANDQESIGYRIYIRGENPQQAILVFEKVPWENLEDQP